MAYQAMEGVRSTASAAAAIATDPYLPEVVGLVLELKESEKSAASSGTSGSTGAGVGLRNVVGPLRAFVKIQKHPWVLPVGVVGVVGLIFAAGYYTRKASANA